MGEGTAIYVGNHLESRELHDYTCSFDDLELITDEIKHKNTTALVSSCYRPPKKASYPQFIDVFCEKISRLTSTVKKCRNLWRLQC